MLRLYDTMRKKVVPFAPADGRCVRMYVCGVTVYDHAHLGHARVMVVFDLLRRWFIHGHGWQVRYVRNFTDVDDKIIRRAAELNIPISELTEAMIRSFHEDMDALGCAPPDEEPRATRYIPQMIAMIQTLVDNGYAYLAENGDVVYAVERFAEYGALSGKKLDELEAGARVEDHAGKRNPLDFVLWKRAKPGEPAWDSPWGPGRPGWHIECAAMSCTLLGETFDLHGGGMDLMFPHHENEIAEARGASCHFARHWMHVGFVQVKGEKMSKSLGNFWTVKDALKRWHPEAVRLFALSAHYRAPLVFSPETLDQMQASVGRVYELWRRMGGRPEPGPLPEAFRNALDDDFNVPKALGVWFSLVKEANRALDRGETRPEAARKASAIAELLGVGAGNVEAWFRFGLDLDEAEIERLIAEREAARKARDFKRADAIREMLRQKGIVVEDTPSGTRWRRA